MLHVRDSACPVAGSRQDERRSKQGRRKNRWGWAETVAVKQYPLLLRSIEWSRQDQYIIRKKRGKEDNQKEDKTRPNKTKQNKTHHCCLASQCPEDLIRYGQVINYFGGVWPKQPKQQKIVLAPPLSTTTKTRQQKTTCMPHDDHPGGQVHTGGDAVSSQEVRRQSRPVGETGLVHGKQQVKSHLLSMTAYIPN